MFNHFQNGSIYSHPATGTYQIYGAIRDDWAQLGWERSPLGYPTSDETPMYDAVGGRHQTFAGGGIWYHPSLGAHEVHGEIVALYATSAWLGYPLTDETGTPDGVGRYNHFQNGSIYWTASTHAHEIHGLIRDKWAALGWERGFLGYPITNETGTPDGVGRYNHFQNGSIYWTPATGAHEIHGAIRDRWAQYGWETSCLGYPISDQFDMYDQDGFDVGVEQSFQHGSISQQTGQQTYVSCQ